MSDQNKLIPKLRFPEFEKDVEWDQEIFDDVFVRLTNKNKENNQNVLTISAQLGLVSQLEYFNKKVAAKDVTGYYLLHKGDFAYNKSYSKGYPMGAIKPLKYYDKGVVSTLYICFRAKDGYSPSFLEQYFEAGLLNSEIAKIAQEGGRAHGLLNVSVKEFFEDILLLIPKSSEQQKIAACLSSLDHLITAHNDKLKALKDHKKGLLQNLFPQEGQKVPNYRFPEFRSEGEWSLKSLGELGRILNGLTYNPKDVRDKGLLVFRSSNVQSGAIDLNDCIYVRKDIKGAILSQPKDILVCVRNGSKRLIGKNAIIPEDIPLATHGAFMTVFRADKPEFVYQLFQSDTYNRQVKADLGATINSINSKNLIKYEFLVPKCPNEQQEIASCLSAIDEFIKAQTEKIKQLQQHKNGLMQGLFPQLSN
ncbi:MAG: restriction endonuclease subunit S [Xanthomonadales bacterium]|nr:restriction endonuclease subunit S [Xanthomonadales bacterium]